MFPFYLTKLFTFIRGIPSVLLAVSSQIASQLSQIHNHTNFSNLTTHIFQSWYHLTHFQGVTTKKYNTFSQSSYQKILTPPELLPNSIQYFSNFLLNKTEIFRELLPNLTDFFHGRWNNSSFFKCEHMLNLYWLG